MSDMPKTQLYLHLPDSELGHLMDLFDQILPSHTISACLFPTKKENMDWIEWQKIYAPLCQLFQQYGCATLIQDQDDLSADLFPSLGFDGLNIVPNMKRLTYWRDRLGEDYILGCDLCDTRHIAMLAGEKLADYIMLPGDETAVNLQELAQADMQQEPSLLQWWTLMMETPAVAVTQKIDPAEFLAHLPQISQQQSDFVILPPALLTNLSDQPEDLSRFLAKIEQILA